VQIYHFYRIVDEGWHLFVFGWGNDEYNVKKKNVDDIELEDGKKLNSNKTYDSSKTLLMSFSGLNTNS
jgi:hypothetical protein